MNGLEGLEPQVPQKDAFGKSQTWMLQSSLPVHIDEVALTFISPAGAMRPYISASHWTLESRSCSSEALQDMARKVSKRQAVRMRLADFVRLKDLHFPTRRCSAFVSLCGLVRYSKATVVGPNA